MSDEELSTRTRINSWFIRGIGLATTLFFAVVLIMIFFVFSDVSTVLPSPSPAGRTFAEALWSLRVYDLLFLVILLTLGVISAAYLLNIKALAKPPHKQQKRRF